jgi:hypothetical protein
MKNAAGRTSSRAILAGIVVGAASLLATASAHAFCRGLTYAGADPSATGVCFDGGGTPTPAFELFWRNRCVGYSLQKDASAQVTLDQATQVAAQAFGAWSSVTCQGGGSPSITATAEDPVTCGLVQYNQTQPNQHVIVFRDDGWPHNDPNNSLGLTTITFDAYSGEIFDADMELNSHDHTFVVGTPAGGQDAGAEVYDLRTVMTHEAGHFLGLAHSAQQTAVMWTFYSSELAGPTPDDVAGICAIYPPDGTRDTSMGVIDAGPCDTTPRHGFGTQCGTDAGTGADATLEYDDAGGRGSGGGQSSSCSVTDGRVAHRAGVPLGGLLALASFGTLLVRRRRLSDGRVAPTRRLGVLLVVCAVASISVLTATGRDARASVSVPALLEDVVNRSDGAAVVTAGERSSVWEDGRIFTYTRVHVDSAVAGTLPQGDLWVRTMGGVVGRIGQVVEGEPIFVPGESSLLFLKASTAGSFEVTARAQGQFRIVRDDAAAAHLERALDVGLLVTPPAGRLVSDALTHRPLQEATREIAAAWATRAR